MAYTISVNKLKVGIDMITSAVSLGILVDSMQGTEIGDAKAKLGSEFVSMLSLMMEDIHDMDPLRALA